MRQRSKLAILKMENWHKGQNTTKLRVPKDEDTDVNVTKRLFSKTSDGPTEKKGEQSQGSSKENLKTQRLGLSFIP